MATFTSALEDGYGLVATSAIVGGIFILPLIASVLAPTPPPPPEILGFGGLDGYEVSMTSDQLKALYASGGGADSDAAELEDHTDPVLPEPIAPVEAPAPATVPSPSATPAPRAAPAPAAKPSGGAPGEGEGDVAGDGQGAGSGGLSGRRVGYDPDNRPARPSGRANRCTDKHPSITKVSHTEYTVERELIEYYAGNPRRLDGLGWIAREGKGWEVGGFGCNGLLFQGGLRRGDVIQSVNGKKVSNLFQALAAYRQFRKERFITVIVERKDERVSLKYEML